MRVKADQHHILHPRLEWTARKEAAALRSSPELIPYIDRDLHNEIHAKAPTVPLLGYHALRAVNHLYVPQERTLDSIDSLMFAIEIAAKHPRAHDIERGMAQLAIEAIEIQRGLLRGHVL